MFSWIKWTAIFLFLFFIVNYWLPSIMSFFASVAIYNFHCSLFVFNTFLFKFFHLLAFGSKTKKVKERKSVLLSTVWIANFLLPIYWKESSHLPIAQWRLLHYGKILHTTNSSIIYTFIVHYPNHLSSWEIQKFSYAPLIHSRYTNLDGV